MPASSNQNLKPKVSSKGFTLIEILIVIVIVSIVSVLGVQMLNSGSIERTVQQRINQFQSSIEYSCEQASLQNRIYGIKLFDKGYSFASLFRDQWQDIVGSEVLPAKQLDDGVYFELLVDGRPAQLAEETGEIPQIICDANGEISAFELRVHNSSNQSVYQLKPKDFWNLEGGWIDEK